MIDTTEQAWAAHQASIAETRALMLARPEAQDPIVRAQALYAAQAMQTVAFQMFMAPRPDYPLFYKQSVWSPFETTFGGPAADFKYQWTFLDGQRTYRVTGKRGTTLFVDFHLFKGYWTDDDMFSIGNYDLDAFEIGPDGSFEFIMSPAPHPGNWVRLDPAVRNRVIQLREAFYDWETEQGAHFHVETLDRPASTMLLTESDINLRLQRTARYAREGVVRALSFADRAKAGAGGVNKFYLMPSKARANDGASPRAGYCGMVFDLKPDEALIIESDTPLARYWSIQLMDLWWQTLDFSHHQSGLNGKQAHIDSDGKFRAVLSRGDPGLPNWLDPVGLPLGDALMRWYDGEEFATPRTKIVPLAEVRRHLPADTPHVSAEQRAQALLRRSRASLRRWGY